MSELKFFLERLNEIVGEDDVDRDIAKTQQVVKEINEFLFNTTEDLGYIHELGIDYKYFSPWHKFWLENYQEILDLRIDDDKCNKVADELHRVYLITGGRAFTEVYDTCGLTNDAVCKIRFLTANQDFSGSREFNKLADIYKKDPEVFSIESIIENPEQFINKIEVVGLSQNDKRTLYAKEIAKFFKDHGCEPIDVIDAYDGDVVALKNDLTTRGRGFAEKKANMVIRDMYVHGIWTNISRFEEIDVPSDINTVKVALRTGILTSAIPLISSFLDIFSPQYAIVDRMNANAWKRVWEIWNEKFPNEAIPSPCMLDYFVYRTVGREFCKPNLYTYTCENGHKLKWHNGQKRKCPECGGKFVQKTRCLPCMDKDGYMVIQNTNFYKSGFAKSNIDSCPFQDICVETNKRNLQPPKSISIRQSTGWETAYTKKGDGGGGLMA